jgi:hypothetical protein
LCSNGKCACPPANVCGSNCLSAPCDSSQCQTCNPGSGNCVGCPSGQTCVNGSCCRNSGNTCSVNGDCCSGICCDGFCCSSGQECLSNGTCANPCNCAVPGGANVCPCLSCVCGRSICGDPQCVGCSAACTTDSDCPKGQFCVDVVGCTVAC